MGGIELVMDLGRLANSQSGMRYLKITVSYSDNNYAVNQTIQMFTQKYTKLIYVKSLAH